MPSSARLRATAIARVHLQRVISPAPIDVGRLGDRAAPRRALLDKRGTPVCRDAVARTQFIGTSGGGVPWAGRYAAIQRVEFALTDED
jgi:hypothetical protein